MYIPPIPIKIKSSAEMNLFLSEYPILINA